MLSLSRKQDESLTITHAGESFTITVVDLRKRRCWLAVDAPQSVVVVRTELLERQTEQESGRTDPAATQES